MQLFAMFKVVIVLRLVFYVDKSRRRAESLRLGSIDVLVSFCFADGLRVLEALLPIQPLGFLLGSVIEVLGSPLLQFGADLFLFFLAISISFS